MKKNVLFLMYFLFLLSMMQAQSQRVKGIIIDTKDKKPLTGAMAMIPNTAYGALADENGNFELVTDTVKLPFTLVISYLGYADKKVLIDATNANAQLTILLEATGVSGSEVTVLGSRVSESVQQSAASIQKINAATIRATASGDFYEGLKTLKDVDILTPSLGFRTFNTRGFNSTSPVRVMQLIDGVDNQAPGLNFPVGNLMGATDVDLQSVEIITGPASALYGPNAFQGVISMTTKDPYLNQGLSVQLKGGSRNLLDGQFRYAKTFAKEKLALKLSGGYMSVKDWAANDKEMNTYGDISTNVDLGPIVRQLEATDSVKYSPLIGYLDFNQQAYPKKININAPGYLESALTDYNTNSLKLGGEVHYKIKDSLRVSFSYKYGKGTAVYQATNRYNIKDITFNQQKVELQGKNFFIRGYNTVENAGGSYDMIFAAINLSKIGITNYVKNYVSQYLETLVHLDSLDGDLGQGSAEQWMIDSARSAAAAVAGANAWLQPNTSEFEAAYDKIKNDANLATGAKFVDASSIQHVEGQYNFKQIKWLDLVAGANYRHYNPQSYGTIFSDTLLNRADTLADGSANLKAKFYNLSVHEVGGYVQAIKQVNDNIKLIASFRADKNQNFKPQFSPRGALVFTKGNHVIRAGVQSAFRIPTLQNQYILLDLAKIPVYDSTKSQTMNFGLRGNLSGNDNLYTIESTKAFVKDYLTNYEANASLLTQITLAPLRPERVMTYELGYRTSFQNRFFVDATGYYNHYQDFIGETRAVRPLNGKAGEDSGVDNILTNQYEVLQIPVNSENAVNAYGASVGMSYFVGKGINLTGNYTYSNLDSSKLDDAIIPGFNTPKHKFNLGIQGKEIWKGLGFNVAYRRQTAFYWQSTFGFGNIPAYGTLDAQVNYAFNRDKWNSVLRVGGSNLLGRTYRTAYGNPLIGRMIYVSWSFDLDKI